MGGRWDISVKFSGLIMEGESTFSSSPSSGPSFPTALIVQKTEVGCRCGIFRGVLRGLKNALAGLKAGSEKRAHAN